jgi:3-dehydroquinate synthetase
MHFKKVNLPTHITDLFKKNIKSKEIIKAMKLDKKTFNNKIKLILVKGIGKAFIYDTVEERKLNIFLKNNSFI